VFSRSENAVQHPTDESDYLKGHFWHIHHQGFITRQRPSCGFSRQKPEGSQARNPTQNFPCTVSSQATETMRATISRPVRTITCLNQPLETDGFDQQMHKADLASWEPIKSMQRITGARAERLMSRILETKRTRWRIIARGCKPPPTRYAQGGHALRTRTDRRHECHKPRPEAQVRHTAHDSSGPRSATLSGTPDRSR
jgi:hypothetical protein